MKLMREICVAGSVIDVSIKIPNGPAKGYERGPRMAPTRESVKKVNERNAVKDLTRKLNFNFKAGDWHLVFTYAGKEPSKEKAKADRETLIRKLSALYKQNGVQLKWVTATEYMHARIHHHMVISYMPYEKIAALWPHGDVRPAKLKSGSYRRLAAYLIKETSKTYKMPGSVTKRRYNCSRSIVTPQVKREKISFATLADDPKPLKGYYIDQDSIRRGIHEVTGYPYLEYEMISLTDEPRLKRWPRGRAVKYKENYNYILRGQYEEDQLALPIYGEEVSVWGSM